MRARIDTDPGQTPSLIAQVAYDDAFLATLKADFNFDASQPEFVDELRRIARIYILDRRHNDDDEWPRNAQKSYRSFLKTTDAFLKWLKESYEHPDFYNIATEMLIVARARTRPEPEPQTEFPGLTEHQRHVEAHYRELLRLTELLKATLARRLGVSKRKPGPKPDFALRHFIIGCSELWTRQLDRKFTIDYHKGSGLTPAFAFVEALLKPLDKVSKREIITAMRAEISALGKLGSKDHPIRGKKFKEPRQKN